MRIIFSKNKAKCMSESNPKMKGKQKGKQKGREEGVGESKGGSEREVKGKYRKKQGNGGGDHKRWYARLPGTKTTKTAKMKFCFDQNNVV